MLDEINQKLLLQLSESLPICSRPYFEIGARLGITENEVISRLKTLQTSGIIKRFGVIVKHSTLGYRANAMCVWRIPEMQIDEIARQLLAFSFVTLCYQRPALPDWNYNLYCMIHGKDRNTVLKQLEQLNETCQLHAFKQEILFSRRCFKQRGAIYQK
jgi:DNA-binding Lrp family transcriptional regulator